MLAKLGRFLRSSFGPGKSRIDAARFGDPLAEETEWTPLVAGGRSFRTNHLVVQSPTRFVFRPSFGTLAVATILVLFGLALAAAGYFVEDIITEPGEFDPRLAAYLLGAMFVLAGAFTWYSLSMPIVFDRGFNAYWRGRLPSGQSVPDATRVRDFTPLQEIHALQILAEWVPDQYYDTYSYELNLVLRDGRRVNVVDHGDLDDLRSDAAELSRLLVLPLWDATAKPEDEKDTPSPGVRDT